MKNLNEDLKTGNIKQAYLLYGEEAYLKKHGDELPEGALSVIDGPEFILDDPKQFERVLGFGWEKNLTREQQSNLKNILGQQK